MATSNSGVREIDMRLPYVPQFPVSDFPATDTMMSNLRDAHSAVTAKGSQVEAALRAQRALTQLNPSGFVFLSATGTVIDSDIWRRGNWT